MSDWLFEPLRPLFYEVICLDPPWSYQMRNAETGGKKSQMAHYDTMSDEEIFSMPVGQLASMDCALFVWATAPRLPQAIEAVRRFGFTYQSVLVWRKRTKNDRLAMGPGYRVRTTGEIVLFATLGNPVQSFTPQTIFDGVRREHSRKPDEFYRMVERMFPHSRRADIFSREERPGWDSWGREVGKFNEQS